MSSRLRMGDILHMLVLTESSSVFSDISLIFLLSIDGLPLLSLNGNLADNILLISEVLARQNAGVILMELLY